MGQLVDGLTMLISTSLSFLWAPKGITCSPILSLLFPVKLSLPFPCPHCLFGSSYKSCLDPSLQPSASCIHHHQIPRVLWEGGRSEMVKLTLVGRLRDGMPLSQTPAHLIEDNEAFLASYRQKAELVLREISAGALTKPKMTILVDHCCFQ